MLDNPLWIVALLVMISVLVAAHEYGHYLFARLFGMDVEEFAIGFGRPKWVWRRKNGTEFTFRPIPLGGFVRIKGMEPQPDGGEVNVPGGFYSRPPIQRLMVLFAGPLFSILFGVLVLIGVFWAQGKEERVNEPVLGVVAPNRAAALAGLKAGDRIVSLDGKPVASFFDIVAYVRTRPEQAIAIEYEREGRRETTTAVPKLEEAPSPVLAPNLEFTGEMKVQAKLGAAPKTERRPVGFGEALGMALTMPIEVAKSLFGLVQQPSRIQEEVGGPGTVALLTHEALARGLGTLLLLTGMLSISLGYLNLLPIPQFDGGQMVVALIEMIRRGKRLSLAIQTGISYVGAALILLLIVYVISLDVSRLSQAQGGSAAPAPAQQR